MSPGMQAPRIELDGEERSKLEQTARCRKTAQGIALRAHIVLLAADGLSNMEIAARLRVSRLTVGKWRTRFLEGRVDGLLELPRPGPPRRITEAKEVEVIRRTLETRPTDAAHWSTRTLATEVGLTQTAISRIWRAFGLGADQSDVLAVCGDALFADRVSNIAGLYVAPPENAVAVCLRETPIEGAPRPSENGEPTVVAKLDARMLEAAADCRRRYRTRAFRRFLDQLEHALPAPSDIHLVMDNFGRCPTGPIRKALGKRPRFHQYFTPTHEFWLHLVERWFALLRHRELRRTGTAHALEAAITDSLSCARSRLRSFVWVQDSDLCTETCG